MAGRFVASELFALLTGTKWAATFSYSIKMWLNLEKTSDVSFNHNVSLSDFKKKNTNLPMKASGFNTKSITSKQIRRRTSWHRMTNLKRGAIAAYNINKCCLILI